MESEPICVGGPAEWVCETCVEHKANRCSFSTAPSPDKKIINGGSMKKLSKDIVSQLRGLYKDMEKEQGEIEAAIGSYNDAVRQVNEIFQQVAGDIEAHIDGHSEKWQESERADAYHDWMYFFEDEKEEIQEPYFEHGDVDEIPLEVEA